MAKIIKDSWQTARKKQICDSCRHVIPKGQLYRSFVGKAYKGDIMVSLNLCEKETCSGKRVHKNVNPEIKKEAELLLT